jgi:CRP-like cAMP-binding protein
LDHVSICIIPSKDFFQILDSCPSVYKELLNYIGERLVRADQKLVSLTQKTLRARLADTLLLLQSTVGEDFEGYINIPLKRSEIAQLSNMTTSNVIRTLSEFKRDKLIDTNDRKIRIIGKETLIHLSEFG